MPDLHALANRPQLARLRIAELRVASVPDGADAAADARLRLARVREVLAVEREILEAVDLRGKLRPAIPPPQSLQDLVRAGRRRLERERTGAARDWHARRLAAAVDLEAGLEG